MDADDPQLANLPSGPGTFMDENLLPWKCPAAGCSKAYRYSQGLSHHKRRVHSNQGSMENADKELEEDSEADAPRLAELVPEQEMSNVTPGTGKIIGEDSNPFKCPETGCTIAYRHQQSLYNHKRHERHQLSVENSDSTSSAVNPTLFAPNAGTTKSSVNKDNGTAVAVTLESKEEQAEVEGDGQEPATSASEQGVSSGIPCVGKLIGDDIYPFKCPVPGCKKTFQRQNNLQNHEQHGHFHQLSISNSGNSSTGTGT
jgi:predicted RNA-binding Zn-ribbon protein involved in translation (DUF1610 family)